MKDLLEMGSLGLDGTIEATHDIHIQTNLKIIFKKLNLQGTFGT